jgi:hypothetical protein
MPLLILEENPLQVKFFRRLDMGYTLRLPPTRIFSNLDLSAFIRVQKSWEF